MKPVTKADSRRKRVLLVIPAAVAFVVLWLLYSPKHWLRRIDWATVKVDDHAVPATVYTGNPIGREAEAVVLVHVPGVGNYLLSFDTEKYREASSQEFVRFYIGAWTFKSMLAGQFGDPLPSQQMNEFRVASSNGHTVVVQF
jgi:hypothetical protein